MWGSKDRTAAARPPREPVAFSAWWLLAVLIVIYGLNALDRGLIGLLVAPIKEHMQINDFEMSLLLGFAFAAFYAICGLPFGWLVDRGSRRLILFFGVAAWSLATIACGLSNTFTQLALARFALGAAEASLGPAAHSLIADSFPKQRLSSALSIYTLGANVGQNLALVLGGVMVDEFTRMDPAMLGGLVPWQATFVAAGIPGLFIALLAFSFRDPGRKTLHAETGPRISIYAFFKSKPRLLTCVFGALIAIMIMSAGIFGWVPAFLGRAFEWSPQKAGAMLALVNLPGAAGGMLIGGLLVDYLVSKGVRDAHMRVLLGVMVIGAPCGLFAFMTTDPTACLIALFLYKLTCFSFFGYGAAAVQLITPSALRGQMAAVYFICLYLIGGGLGPTLIGINTSFIFGDPNMLGPAIALVIAVLAPIGILFAWLSLKPMREEMERLSA